jgi:spore coat polysaccharide biosynthesis predicted glycosyltransferase SpsG
VVVGHDYAGPLPPGAEVVRDPADLPSLVAGADVVLIGAGTMKFEAATLGRPAVLVAVADDQRRVGPAFARTGAALWLGDGRTVDPGVVWQTVAGLVADPTTREAMSGRARRTIDGGGADRLAAEILSLA